jgi:undecaprenyl diphosphate synthase
MDIPRHIAIIMDGNGRWAEKRRLPRVIGHQRRVDVVQKVVTECRRLGVGYLTLYAFSSENWKRPEEEVSALMGLLGRYLRSELSSLLDQGIRLKVIGETDRLPGEIRQVLTETMERTAGNSAMTLTLALSYGGRNEIVRAIGKLIAAVQADRIAPAQIDETMLAGFLDTADLPDPDLLIRTSGEMRISNFLLWQLAYTELYFTKVLWPDFSLAELQRALAGFNQRQRRFGLTGAQLADDPDPRGEKHH